MTEPGSDPIAWLLAHEQIRQLASRYAVALGRETSIPSSAYSSPTFGSGPAKWGETR